MTRRTLIAIAVAALASGTAAIVAGATITLTASHRAASTAPPGLFDGTPAAGWPPAEAGIGTPKPTSVDGWTEAQVADALTRVRAALLATRLDERMLVRHDPSAFLALLAPAQREQAKAQLTVVATRIDPAARLAAPPRVRGRTTFQGVRDEYGRPALEVVTNHVWAYVFSAGSAPAVVHDEARWTFYQGTRVRSADSGMWLKQAKAYVYQMDCAAHRLGFLAPQAPGAPSAAPADESFYDPDRPVDAPSTC